MKIGVYFCDCGTIIKEKIDYSVITKGISIPNHEIVFHTFGFMCSDTGKKEVEETLRKEPVDRLVVAACSPRDHEQTFMKIMLKTGMNPFFLAMVNMREQVAWVTTDPEKATQKGLRYVRAAIQRSILQEPLEKREIEISPNAIVIGGGPAGLSAALSLAEAGRKVVVIEKSAAIGGLPVRYEEVFPRMECGPCLLEPMMDEVLHGPTHENIELFTLAEVESVVGFYGNFKVTIKQKARKVNPDSCVGCMECVGPCPVSSPNPYNYGMNEMKAIDFAFPGCLPFAPAINDKQCVRTTKGESCTLCRDACPVPDTILLDEKDKTIEREAGALILAVGAAAYDVGQFVNLGYKKFKDIYTNMEFERLLAANGPTSGSVQTAAGTAPKDLTIIHCVGSLDPKHCKYCSGTCCAEAFKLSHLMMRKEPNLKVHHIIKEIALDGKRGAEIYSHLQNSPQVEFIRYKNLQDISLSESGGKKQISYKDISGKSGNLMTDILVLSPAVVPSSDAHELGKIFDVELDQYGFFEEMHDRVNATRSKLKGVFLAGDCQAPMDIRSAMTQGKAAAGQLLSGLIEGKKLELSAIHAVVDQERCSGCRICQNVCPYKAITFDTEKKVSTVSEILCQSCGTCVAACPIGAIKGKHFTGDQILAEIEEVLS